MISKNSTREAWKETLREVFEKGKDFKDRDGRICRELTNLKIEIKNPSDDVTEPIEIISRSKKWVYPRIDEIASSTLTRKASPGHLYVYGHRIFSYDEEINQIDKFVIPLLRKDKTTRRAVATIWNPKSDSTIFNKEVPSIMMIQFIIREKRLETSAVIRSNNVFFGFPANIYQIYLIMEYVSSRLGIEDGGITLYILSAHIFEDHFSDVKEIISS